MIAQRFISMSTLAEHLHQECFGTEPEDYQYKTISHLTFSEVDIKIQGIETSALDCMTALSELTDADEIYRRARSLPIETKWFLFLCQTIACCEPETMYQLLPAIPGGRVYHYFFAFLQERYLLLKEKCSKNCLSLSEAIMDIGLDYSRLLNTRKQ